MSAGPDPAWSVSDPIGAQYVAQLAAEHVPVVRRRWLLFSVRYCATCPGRGGLCSWPNERVLVPLVES